MMTAQQGRYTLFERGLIVVKGDDRFSFLQGLVTNDVEQARDGGGIYSCLLTPQGKYLFDFFILEFEDSIIIECQSDKVTQLTDKLKKHKLRSSVDFEDISRGFLYITLYNSKGLDLFVKNKDFGLCYKDPRLPDFAARMIVMRQKWPAVQLRLEHHGFSEGDTLSFHRYRLEHGIPDGGTDMIPESSTMLECNMDLLNALSWDKGCYMGQELTARTHYRGLVKKRLCPVRIQGEVTQTDIRLDDQLVGELRSHNEDRGMALLKVETIKDMPALNAGSARIFPEPPAWLSSIF